MSKVKNLLVVAVAAIVTAPAFVSAQLLDLTGNTSPDATLARVFQLINAYVIPFIITLAVIYFLIGVFNYVRNGDNEEERKKAQSGMLYGIIGLVVMFSFWGLVRFVQSGFGLQTDQSTTGPGGLPQVGVPTVSNND